MPHVDLAILNNLDVRESFLSTSLGTLDGAIPISLLLHPSCRKPVTLVTYSDEVLQDYKNICFTDGSKFNGRVGLVCVIYEEGFEKATFQHRIRDECSVFQAELLCINLAVKVIQDSLHQGDGGSQASFVDVKLIDKLKLNVINSSSLRVQAFESSFTQEQRRCVQLTLSGLWSKRSILITAFESNNSYTTHPAATLEISQFAHKKKLKLADPPDNSSLPIELLIGGDYYENPQSNCQNLSLWYL
ncbi:integrase catalytic domain-containing protein [Nephila pilipes]|uniref:Integrase catalytic domain-containing protein n=1 Tax=Nephila pilipes TaxID=299642 RepID=A0A8X6PHK0_NEPPI|nr:integrase catalytic domain-containing protein [Nephila pilipes]